MISLYDAHNHFQDDWLSPYRTQVVADLERIELRRAVVNGTSETDWDSVAELGRKYAFVLPSYGLHPWDVGNASPRWRDSLRIKLDADPHAAIGEIGLDRWILDRARPDDPRLQGLRRAGIEEQTEAFHWQLALATQRNLPVTIHCIDAWGPLTVALRETALPRRGFLLHAYGGSAELARQFATQGAYFSFNGYFLGERQAAKRAVFANVPMDRLLVETDAPAMSLPQDRRKHTLPDLADGTSVNHPANIEAVYAGLAEVRGVSVETLATQIEQNFQRLFGAR
jgi:TatD DNase family protein